MILSTLHISTLPQNERSEKSIKNINELKKYGFDVKYIKNDIYENGDYNLEHVSVFFRNHHPHKRHYGCYLAHKEAINSINKDFEFTIIMEEDAYIDNYMDFLESVIKAYFEFKRNEDIYYISFQSYYENADGIDHNSDFIEILYNYGTGCYMIATEHKNWYVEKFNSEKWDTTDYYYIYVFSKELDKKRLVYKNQTVRQLECMSIIDQVIRPKTK